MKKEKPCYVGFDIGGTNTKIGIAIKEKNKIKIIKKFHFETGKPKKIEQLFTPAINFCKKNNITIKKTCLAIAGPVTKKGNYCKMTNAKWTFKRDELNKKMKINIIPFMNDVEAQAHTLDYKDKKTKTIIAIGTGLGKCTIKNLKIIPSELGNSKMPLQKEDKELLKHIKIKNKTGPVYEDLISGKGIERIYEYVKQKNSKKNSDKYNKPSKNKEKNEKKIELEIKKSKLKSVPILNYAKKDKNCKETTQIFTKYCARFVRLVAIKDKPLGGIYLTGGIAHGHKEIFQKEFVNEFQSSKTQQKILKATPIYVVLEYDIGLIGSCIKAAEN